MNPWEADNFDPRRKAEHAERLERWEQERCREPVEVYARVTGFFRPVHFFNKGKRQEFRDRKNYKVGNLEESRGNI